MKKLFIIMLMALPLMCQAKGNDDSKYLKGAVPEENGIVTFRKTISVEGKSQQEIYSIMNRFVQEALIAPAIQGERTRIISDGKADGKIVARVEEYMVFKQQFLNLDRTRFRYQFSVQTSDGKAELVLTQISYYYNENMEGEAGEAYKAEEWITDAEALNKKGTKLYPRSGKFRRLTVDRVNAIFINAEDAFYKKQR